MTAPRIWLIWSNEHGAFWRSEAHGYTSKIESAGRYTEAVARARCEIRKTKNGEPGEIMVPAPEALSSISTLYQLINRGIGIIENVDLTDEFETTSGAWVDEAKTIVENKVRSDVKERAET